MIIMLCAVKYILNVFTALTSSGVDCPLKGKYQVTSGERACTGRLIGGCNRSQQMNIKCGPQHSSDTCKHCLAPLDFKEI